MNIFSRIKNAVVGVLGGKVNSRRIAPEVKETRKGKLRFDPLKSHTVRFRPTVRGKHGSIKGPVFVPSADWHHVSRQTCRARLRGVFFQKFSAEYPNASRRQRRRVSFVAAALEYRAMMRDNTNEVAQESGAVA